MRTMNKHDPCPCCSGSPYSECCARLHTAENQPSQCTPVTLMRSRYCAFYLGNFPYLVATLHPSQRSPDDSKTLASTAASTQWLSLKIINSPTPQATNGSVEFVAFFHPRGDEKPTLAVPHQLHEKSQFCFDQNRWWYFSGDILEPIKLGRNDPCWCGSAKKMKKCHG